MKNKKHLIVTLIVLIVVASCFLGLSLLSKDDDVEETIQETYNISVTAPAGAPALTLAGPLADDQFNFDYEIVDGAEPLSAEFMTNEKDLIIAPINLGLKLIEKGAKYKLISVLTWGNLKIVGDKNNYGTIAAFGEGAVPGIVLESVHNLLGNDQQIDYFSSVQEASSMFLNGDYHAVMLAEPVLTKVKKNYADTHDGAELYELFDIQELYDQKTGCESFPQAALFVKDETMENEVDKIVNFCSDMKSSIEAFNADPKDIITLNVDFEKLGFSNPEMLASIYPNMAINYVYAQECTNSINTFLNLFNTSLADDSFVK